MAQEIKWVGVEGCALDT